MQKTGKIRCISPLSPLGNIARDRDSRSFHLVF
jgi:hypothetical protein